MKNKLPPNVYCQRRFVLAKDSQRKQFSFLYVYTIVMTHLFVSLSHFLLRAADPRVGEHGSSIWNSHSKLRKAVGPFWK